MPFPYCGISDFFTYNLHLSLSLLSGSHEPKHLSLLLKQILISVLFLYFSYSSSDNSIIISSVNFFIKSNNLVCLVKFVCIPLFIIKYNSSNKVTFISNLVNVVVSLPFFITVPKNLFSS